MQPIMPSDAQGMRGTAEAHIARPLSRDPVGTGPAALTADSVVDLEPGLRPAGVALTPLALDLRDGGLGEGAAAVDVGGQERPAADRDHHVPVTAGTTGEERQAAGRDVAVTGVLVRRRDRQPVRTGAGGAAGRP